MSRARRPVPFRLVPLLAFLLVTRAGIDPDGLVPAAGQTVLPAATVSWSVSTGLLVAEVVTGGSSASDEYVELTNAGSVPADLAGLELVYVTSSGGTVTRKVSWTTSTRIDPGRHLLIANASGIWSVATSSIACCIAL